MCFRNNFFHVIGYEEDVPTNIKVGFSKMCSGEDIYLKVRAITRHKGCKLQKVLNYKRLADVSQ